MDELLNIGASALKKIALNEEAKEYILHQKPLYTTLKKAANRFIGGESLVETIPKVTLHNKNGFKCSIEFMGESTKTEKETTLVTAEFIKIAQEIKRKSLNSTISLDLSHIGLAISKDLCLNNLNLICKQAKKHNTEVIISAEGIDRTDDIIETYKTASKTNDNLAITLQAYLYRTKDDFEDLIKETGRIRVVKGAFATPAGHSMPRGNKLDDIYLDYVDQLLSKNHKCSIASHHSKIQQEAKRLILGYKNIDNIYEFESLYGIQNEQLAQLKQEGFNTKIYFVYGKEWYLYLCNRIAEYPLNIFQALADITNNLPE